MSTGKWDVDTKGEFKVTQNDDHVFYLDNAAYLDTTGRIQLKSGQGSDGVHYTAAPGGLLQVHSTANTEMKADTTYKVDATDVQITAKKSIVLSVGGSTVTIDTSGVTIAGPVVKLNATSGNTEIDAATQVKIKS